MHVETGTPPTRKGGGDPGLKAFGGAIGREHGGRDHKTQARSPARRLRLPQAIVEAIVHFAMGKRLSKTERVIIERLSEDDLGEALDLLLAHI
jgi:hypothetical protein